MISLQQFLDDLETEGREILEFWMQKVIDTGNSRIAGQVNNDNSIDPEAPLSGILISRMVWTFSRAYGHYRKNRYLEYAEFTYNYLIEHFWDHKYGGIYWEATPAGDITDTRKQLYAQAFAVYALSEFYTATGFDDALEKAYSLHCLMETHGSDPEYGGYREACQRDWTPADDLVLSSKESGSQKTMNTHLHILESCTNLLTALAAAARPEQHQVREHLTAQLEFFIGTIYNPRTRHLDLYFTRDWQVTKFEYSPGHDIEAAWLLKEALHTIQDTAPADSQTRQELELAEHVQTAALELAEATLETGMRANGSLITDYPAEEEHTGYITTTATSEWWPQAEAWTGFLDAYQTTKDQRHLAAARRAYDWGRNNLKDHHGGEWYFGINPDGTLSTRGKAGFWKCPYHSWRACHEGVQRLTALL
ncbi:MAG: AGE family epimerase/isomerase [Spirochaetales bacterium]|nr:AGE family epimerase/isomerase [Spirochaetales bacterium]